jgi:phosphoglycerol transferase MdoB-like AlkP superfamily enzyme
MRELHSGLCMQAPSGGTALAAPAPKLYGVTQAAIAIWLVVASRVVTGTGLNAAGALDDASLVALFVALQLALHSATRRLAGVVRIVAISTPVVLLALGTLSNVLFFRFFKTNLSFASLQVAGLALDAGSSVAQLVHATDIGVMLLVPLAMQVFSVRKLRPVPAGSHRPLVAALLVFGLLLAGLSAITRKPVFLFPERNALMDLARDSFARVYRVAFSDAEDQLARLPDEVFSLLNREGYPGYQFAGSPEHPLLQRAPSQPREPGPDAPRNVVLILMESMRGLEMQGGFRELPVTPALNGLEAQSLVFPNFYANGMTTVDAEFSILCSALPVVNEAPLYVRKPTLDIRCLPEILGERGYSTHWISAYRSNYANKRLFLKKHGVSGIHDEKSMQRSRARHPNVGWGMGDVDMFEQALEKIGRFREPFFVEIMTLSNHHPFDHDYDMEFPERLGDVPGNSHYRSYLRGMHYTDRAVGEFIEAARSQPWFAHTLFVILGDHAVRAYPTSPEGSSLGPVLETEIYFRGRLLLYAPGWLDPASHEVLGSQIDVAPTLLDLLGVSADNSFMGVSLLADVPADRRFALTNIGHVFNMRVGNHYCYSVGYSCFQKVFPRCPKGVAATSRGHTCFEASEDLLQSPDLPGGSQPIPATPLDPLQQFRVLDRAERIMRLNRLLIEQDRFR